MISVRSQYTVASDSRLAVQFSELPLPLRRGGEVRDLKHFRLGLQRENNLILITILN